MIVRANSYNYASSGSFDCSNGGRAFFPNETLAINTTCLYNATWDQEDNVQCWTGLYRAKIAPNISYVRANKPQSRILIARMLVVQMLVFVGPKAGGPCILYQIFNNISKNYDQIMTKKKNVQAGEHEKNR